jgi:DNA-binding NarL/FixJ family response regulator
VADANRVVIADDHASMRAGVRLALEGTGFAVVGEAADTPGAVRTALAEKPHLCLLDIHMPGEGGIEACAQITAQLPETKVVMLTVSRNDSDVFDAIEAGASGYLLKGMDPTRLAAAIRGVLEGEAAFPRTLVARVIDEFRGRARHGQIGIVRPSEHDLTSREWEVLDLLADDLRTGEIGQRLIISDTTVRRHVGSILRKLDVPDREAAVELARPRSRNLNDE